MFVFSIDVNESLIVIHVYIMVSTIQMVFYLYYVQLSWTFDPAVMMMSPPDEPELLHHSSKQHSCLIFLQVLFNFIIISI